jgi:hypothetical protein
MMRHASGEHPVSEHIIALIAIAVFLVLPLIGNHFDL